MFQTQIIILGIIDYILDQLSIKENRFEIRNQLLSAIIADTMTALLQKPEFVDTVNQVEKQYTVTMDSTVKLQMLYRQIEKSGSSFKISSELKSSVKTILNKFILESKGDNKLVTQVEFILQQEVKPA